MVHPHQPGAPLVTTPAPPEQIVSTFGDMEAKDGGVIRLAGDCLVFSVKLGEAECEVGVGLTDLLEAIQEYTKRVES